MTLAGGSVLVTGPPGAGKSTIVQEVSAAFSDIPQTGFVTREVRRDGQRAGFEIHVPGVDLTGLLASPDTPGDLRFGTIRPDGTRRLGVDLTFLEDVACVAVADQLATSTLVIIDEIGPMQIASPAFTDLLATIMASPAVLIASVALDHAPILDRLSAAAVDAGHMLPRGFSRNREVRESVLATTAALVSA
jgi:nucleoside-triphosphatase